MHTRHNAEMWIDRKQQQKQTKRDGRKKRRSNIPGLQETLLHTKSKHPPNYGICDNYSTVIEYSMKYKKSLPTLSNGDITTRFYILDPVDGGTESTHIPRIESRTRPWSCWGTYTRTSVRVCVCSPGEWIGDDGGTTK